MSDSRKPLVQLLMALLVSLLAYWLRGVHGAEVAVPSEGRWITMDSDSEYHMRRLERALAEGGSVDGRDPYLDYPSGSAIPWPPYYTELLRAVLGPFAPAERGARRVYVEQGVASVPRVLGSATSGLCVLAAGALAGPAAGAFAGIHHALSLSSITYSRAGNGDHHAWVSLLLLAMLVVTARAFRDGGRAGARGLLVHGALAGAIAGLLLGSWVASLLYVVGIDLFLGCLLLWHARRPWPGLAAFGLAYHLVAALVLLPAVLQSPWRTSAPWMMVNLSWFHPLFLLLGALVFLPLPFLASEGRRPRSYPWLVALALAGLAAACLALDVGPAAALREALAWIGRKEEFMAQVGESLPLVGRRSDFPRALSEHLGLAILLLPLCALAALVLAWRRRDARLLLWAVTVAWLAPQAALQRRFADPLAPVAAVLLAWGLAHAGGRLVERLAARLPKAARMPAAAALALLSQSSAMVQPTLARLVASDREPSQEERGALAARLACDWIATHTPSPADYAVLSTWGNGHLIEWGADRPSVATNFGSYVGREGFETPARFFLAEDSAAAEALLERRRARYVLLFSGLPRFVGEMVLTACPESWERYIDGPRGGGGGLREPFFDTLAAQLLLGGVRLHTGAAAGPSLDFLRLLHASPLQNEAAPLALAGMSKPFGFVWEHVPGARLSASGRPGEELRVQIRLQYAAAGYKLQFQRAARVGSDGRVLLRVPYATLSENGDGQVLDARWSLGERGGRLAIHEEDVLQGRPLELE